MKNSILILLLCVTTVVMAQDKAAIEAALKTFDDATDVNGMSLAVAEMKAVSDKNPDDWHSAYWTSFFYSQTGRLTQSAAAYYDSAQIYFDRASAANTKPRSTEASDFHALQYLIYNLQSVTFYQRGDIPGGQKVDAQANQQLNQAMKLNEDNPRVYLLLGTDLVSTGLRVKSNGWILAGKTFLEKAKGLYASKAPASSIAPSWGSGWINFWMSRAKVD